MKKWLIAGLVVVALLAAPASALGTPKRKTAIRAMWSSYTLPGTAPEVRTVKGHLVFRSQVIRHGKRVFVDKVQNGTVGLQRFNDDTGDWVGVTSTRTVDGRFSFRVYTGARYRVRFAGNSTRWATAKTFYVLDHHLHMSKPHAISASIETSGDLFVTVAVDVNSTDSDITSETPAGIALQITNALPSMGMPVADASSLYFGYWARIVSAPGTVRAGFTVPAGAADSLCFVEAYAVMPFSSHASVSAETSFTPSDFLP